MKTKRSGRRASAPVLNPVKDVLVTRSQQKKTELAATLNSLPGELGRNRILNSEAAAAFWCVSVPHWRRLYRAGKVPSPIKVGERKLGWRIGALVDAIAAREAAQSYNQRFQMAD